MTITLRPYQTAFIDAVRSKYHAGRRSVLGVAPTGAGKTIMFSDMAASAAAKGMSVGIVAHRVEILDQIGKALAQFGVNHGYLAPGFSPNPMAQVQVCSVQAMGRRIERYIARPFDFLIVDEAHHAAAGSAWHAVINAHASKRILGVTATPQRLGGEPLGVAFEDMVIGPSVSELISIGALTPYRLFAPRTPDMSGVGKRGGDYIRSEVAGVMDKPTITGDAVAHYKQLCNGKRAVVFCASVEHAEHVAEQFESAGVKAASLDGGMDKIVRRGVLTRFASGIVPVLTSCDIVSEGFDLPAIEAAILLRPTSSLALYLQQVGRALRPHPGKREAIILDHAGNSLPREMGGRGHGFPDDPRDWSLDGAQARKQTGERTIQTVICGTCFGVFRPAPCCPYCGATRDIHGRVIAYVDGVLEEVDPDLVRVARRQEQDAINDRVRKTRGVDALARLAVEIGRDAGWVWNTHKHRGNPAFMYGEAVKAVARAKREMADG